MSSNKSKKSIKSAKVALPIFALFGGQGFASSRNPLTMQSSKRTAEKSITYIDENKVPTLPALGTKESQNAKSPFAAFTVQTLSPTKSASLDIKLKTLEFLNKNNLLTSNKYQSSKTSGNTAAKSRKSFTDVWQIPATTGFSNQTCPNTMGPNKYFIGGKVTGTQAQPFATALRCLYTSIGGTISSTKVDFNQPYTAALMKCRVMHANCYHPGMSLPVELQSFKIE